MSIRRIPPMPQVLCLVLLLLANQAYSFAPASPGVARIVSSSMAAVRTPKSLASCSLGRRTCRRDIALWAQEIGSSSGNEDKVNPSKSLVTKAKSWLQERAKKLHPSQATKSTAWLIALDVAFRQVFGRLKIRFPSSLAGCGVVLAVLLVAQLVKKPGDEGTALYQALQPGAALLAKWLPVFFVPSLVTLPLAEGLGSVSDLIKVTVVLLCGFFFTLFTTAQAVLAVRRPRPVQQQEKQDEEITTVNAEQEESSEKNAKSSPGEETPATPARKKPFSGKLLSQLTLASLVTGLLAQSFVGAAAAQFLTGVCFLTATLASFVFGARLPPSFVKMVHPVVTCTTMTWGVVAVLASLMGYSFRGLLRCYKTGSLWTGAGDVLLFLLGPAVVSLAVSIFERRQLVRDNAAAVATAVAVATVGGVGGTALAVRLCGIGMPAVRLSLLSRNITSPLAMAMATLLGADVSLAVSMVVLTGLVGANFGASLLTAAGIRDPVARGLSMGAAAHGLGTAALAGKEPTAFSFSAIAMALVASAATVTVSIPMLRRIVLELALG